MIFNRNAVNVIVKTNGNIFNWNIIEQRFSIFSEILPGFIKDWVVKFLTNLIVHISVNFSHIFIIFVSAKMQIFPAF